MVSTPRGYRHDLPKVGNCPSGPVYIQAQQVLLTLQAHQRLSIQCLPAAIERSTALHLPANTLDSQGSFENQAGQGNRDSDDPCVGMTAMVQYVGVACDSTLCKFPFRPDRLSQDHIRLLHLIVTPLHLMV